MEIVPLLLSSRKNIEILRTHHDDLSEEESKFIFKEIEKHGGVTQFEYVARD